MFSSKILLVEGKRTDHPSFTAGLTKKGYLVESVPSGTAALARVEDSTPDLVIIDASSMRSSGKRICQSIHDRNSSLPIILVIDPDSDPNDNYGANTILVLPFTLQKLANRIRQLMPIKNNGGVCAGPFLLDVSQKRVIHGEKQIQLTPRLTTIFRILLEHAGEVVERETLFREAWETDYTIDTRSLDVHMSWLRQAIEENPRRPKFIRTLRGVGYRLDVEPAPKPKSRKK